MTFAPWKSIRRMGVLNAGFRYFVSVRIVELSMWHSRRSLHFATKMNLLIMRRSMATTEFSRATGFISKGPLGLAL